MALLVGGEGWGVVVLVRGGGGCLGWLGAGWLGWLAVVVGCAGWGAGWLGWLGVLVGWAGCVVVGGAGWCVAGGLWWLVVLVGGAGCGGWLVLADGCVWVMVGRAGWWCWLDRLAVGWLALLVGGGDLEMDWRKQ